MHSVTKSEHSNSIGFIDCSFTTGGDNVRAAKQVLVFMITAINDSWKIPVGYFFIESLLAEQKKQLVITCLTLLIQSNVEPVSITCDGCPSNG